MYTYKWAEAPYQSIHTKLEKNVKLNYYYTLFISTKFVLMDNKIDKNESDKENSNSNIINKKIK